MNIVVDVTHPGHVHFFKYAIEEWKKHGHNVTIAARDKDITLSLLDDYGYQYFCLSRVKRGMVGFVKELLEHESKLFSLARKVKADVLLNIGGTFIVHTGKLLDIPTIVFTDTEHAKLSNGITFPFATKICTPDCFEGDLGRKQLRYAGYHELAYLHPKYFTPNPKVLEAVGMEPHERFFVVRFVSWGAAHDIGQKGFTSSGKRELIRRLAELGRVIITSEAPLLLEFEPYRMNISPTKIHDLLYYSTLFIGEGATMASEAAIMGTPAIYVNPLSAGTLQEQEQKYGLLFNITDERRATEQAINLAYNPNVHNEYQKKREILLADKIDVTAWMVNLVENYLERATK